MRAFELKENDNYICHRLRHYYKIKKGRTGIGLNSYYTRLKRDFADHLSEHFLDSKVEDFIVQNLSVFSSNNPIIAVDISTDFGEHREELLITIRELRNNELKTHDRELPESDRLVFDTIDDARSFVMGLKLQVEGNTEEDYDIIIYDELESKK